MRLRIGTRASPLAQAQAAWTEALLCKRQPGLEIERVLIRTSGDAFSAAWAQGLPAPAQSPDANIKALFVKEIEEALLSGKIDLAVHSCKDLPGESPEGLVIFHPEREDPRDSFIPGESPSWAALPRGAVIGTASPRRQAQLLMARPDLRFSPVRGNVGTRLRKLRENGLNGLVLAEAGLRRLGLKELRREPLPLEVLTPAPGQGALALQTRAGHLELVRLLESVQDERTAREVFLERAFLQVMGGGCSMPLGAYAQEREGKLHLRVFWSSRKEPARFLEGSCGLLSQDAQRLVSELAQQLK
ncbi:MAG: hydroxymethylbilane synthase [Elusimicrobiota bacterium]|jgi:hydroxymethylbilane synthase